MTKYVFNRFETARERPAITTVLSDWVAALKYADLGADAVEAAKRSIADTVGVGLAGRGEPVAHKALSICEGESGRSAIWGNSTRTTARNAAFVNGVMSHAHDFDDGNGTILGHPSTSVVPALLAIADERTVSGEELITAYVAGVEVAAKVSKAITYEHNANGWHTTSTMGTLASAVAVAKLLGLDATGIRHALGIAASMACGVRQNFGTDTKPVHAGWASQNGVAAAKLAAAGIDASPTAIEGHEGFLHLYGDLDVAKLEDGIAGLGAPFDVTRNNLKLYPNCAMVLPAQDIVIEAVARGELSASEVASIECAVSYQDLNIMRYRDPQTPMQAKFSIDYCLAVALLFGTVVLDDFTEDAIRRPAVREVMKKIDVSIHPDLSTPALFEPAYKAGKAFIELRVKRTNGTEFVQRQSGYRGNWRHPASWNQLARKFSMCAAKALDTAATARVWTRLTGLNELKGVSTSALLDA